MTEPISINFNFCAPKIFHMVFGFKELNSFFLKNWFKFGNRVTFGKGQRMTLTFDTHVGSLHNLVQ